MPSRIRPNYNQPTVSVPCDSEVGAVITTPYYFNRNTDRWEAATTELTAVSTASAVYTTAGDHTLVPVGTPLRVHWVFAQAKSSVGQNVVLITFRLGTRILYRAELTGSQPFSHRAFIEGAAGESLIINLDSNWDVIVNADYTTA